MAALVVAALTGRRADCFKEGLASNATVLGQQGRDVLAGSEVHLVGRLPIERPMRELAVVLLDIEADEPTQCLDGVD